jgi:hypothetical protein
MYGLLSTEFLEQGGDHVSDSPSYLYEFFIKTKETLETYGPYFEIDEEIIGETNPLQIWSVAEMDDGTHLMNGLLKGPAIDSYLRSNSECALEPHTIDVFISHVTDCLDCDDEGCQVCNDEGMVLIEFADFISFEPVTANSNEELWDSRTAL